MKLLAEEFLKKGIKGKVGDRNKLNIDSHSIK